MRQEEHRFNLFTKIESFLGDFPLIAQIAVGDLVELDTRNHHAEETVNLLLRDNILGRVLLSGFFELRFELVILRESLADKERQITFLCCIKLEYFSVFPRIEQLVKIPVDVSQHYRHTTGLGDTSVIIYAICFLAVRDLDNLAL